MGDVIERAEAEAEREYVPGLTLTAWERVAFIKGATFAATITPEQVEAGARALWQLDYGGPENGFADCPESVQQYYRGQIIAAARAMGFIVEDES